MRALLLNSRYCGVLTYYGADPVPAAWPAIISEREHEKAVMILTDPARRTHVGTARRWLGAGLFRCGVCGDVCKSGYRQGRRTYDCRQLHDVPPAERRPGRHVVRVAERIDELVVGVVEELLARPDAADLLAGSSADLAPLRTEAAALRRRLDVALDRLDRGVLDEAQFVKPDRTIKAELAVVERRIAHAMRDDVLAQLGAAGDPVSEFRSASLALRRQVIDALFSVTLLPGKPGRPRAGQGLDPSTVRIEPRA